MSRRGGQPLAPVWGSPGPSDGTRGLEVDEVAPDGFDVGGFVVGVPVVLLHTSGVWFSPAWSACTTVCRLDTSAWADLWSSRRQGWCPSCRAAWFSWIHRLASFSRALAASSAAWSLWSLAWVACLAVAQLDWPPLGGASANAVAALRDRAATATGRT